MIISYWTINLNYERNKKQEALLDLLKQPTRTQLYKGEITIILSHHYLNFLLTFYKYQNNINNIIWF